MDSSGVQQGRVRIRRTYNPVWWHLLEISESLRQGVTTR
jgi:hypothetical protein